MIVKGVSVTMISLFRYKVMWFEQLLGIRNAVIFQWVTTPHPSG